MPPTASVDRWLGPLLFLTAFACVAALPHHLGESDESLLLYETLRIMRGEVFYRDIFNNITPGAHFVFLVAFRLFGASIATARLTIAAVHGLLALTLFACCRRLDVRPGLAAAAVFAHLAFDQPAFPYASPHWLSALLGLALLLVALRRPWQMRPIGAAWLGVLSGALTAVHHQRGAVMLPAALAVVLADWLIVRRAGAAEPSALLRRRLLWLVAAYAAVVVPFFAGLVLWAGPGPFWAALVEFPLVHYRRFHQTLTWGEVNVLTAPLAAYTMPRLLAALPLAVLPVLARLVVAIRQGDVADARHAGALTVIGLFTIASTFYNPDFIHLAFIAPVFWVALAADIEWAWSGAVAPTRGAGARVSAVVVALLVLTLVAQIVRNVQRSYAQFAVAVATPFGRIDLHAPETAALVARLRELADAAPDRQLFVYPGYPALYLMTGTDNPTPFQILLPGYNPPAAIDAAREILARQSVPLVVLVPPLIAADDPIVSYVRDHYDRIDMPSQVPGAPTVYRRKQSVGS